MVQSPQKRQVISVAGWCGRPRRTFEGAVGSDVVDDEAGGKHQQHHQQFGPGEAAAAHLCLKVLGRGDICLVRSTQMQKHSLS